MSDKKCASGWGLVENLRRRGEWRPDLISWHRHIPILRFLWLKEKQAAQELIDRLPELTGVVVDLGCGTGDSSFHFLSNLRMFGLDKSPSRPRQARKNPRPPLIAADVHHLPFKVHSVKVFTAIGLAEYLPDLTRLIDEVTQSGETQAYLLLTSSPCNLFGFLRRFLGKRLYLRRAKNLLRLFTLRGFSQIGNRRLPTQDLFLFKLPEKASGLYSHSPYSKES